MSVFRPSNINKRLAGIAGTSGGSPPGNAGQIGPNKTPYLGGFPQVLGRHGICGSCAGVFKANESRCGVKESCKSAFVDCKGVFICCGPGTVKWFVAPNCSRISRCWYCRADAITVADSCLGVCGWFLPSCTFMLNPGLTCRKNWDKPCALNYWSDSDLNITTAWSGNTTTGCLQTYGQFGHNKERLYCLRAFRCTPT